MLKYEDSWYITWHTLVTFTTSSIVYTLQALSRGSVAVTNSIRINILIAVTRKAHPNWSKPSCWVSKVTITAQVTARSWHTTNTPLLYKYKFHTTVSIYLKYSLVLPNQIPLIQSPLIYTPMSACWDAVLGNPVHTYKYSGVLSTYLSHSTQCHITENSIRQTYIPVSFHITH